MSWPSAPGVRQPTLGDHGRNSGVGGDANERRGKKAALKAGRILTGGFGPESGRGPAAQRFVSSAPEANVTQSALDAMFVGPHKRLLAG